MVFSRAQIGKGMWAMPDKMKDMLKEKINHLKVESTRMGSFANSCPAHALHYH